jgi:O-antigen/teichoic acid export membrane protein
LTDIGRVTLLVKAESLRQSAANPQLSDRDGLAFAIAAPELTSGRLLARNTLLNLGGEIAPLLVAVIAIPILMRSLGTAQFGVLTIAWGVVGYFGVFDLGLGRAMTKLIAERVGDGRQAEIPDLFWTGNLLLFIFGSIGGVLLAILARPLAFSLLKMPNALREETCTVFRLLALCLPLVLGVAGFRGALASYQRFDLLTKLRIPLGVFSMAGPLLVLPFSRSIVAITTVLVANRLVGWLLHLFVCTQVIPQLAYVPVIRRRCVRPLLSLGGWIAVSNVCEPILVYCDRFIIGAVISVSVVAYYTPAYDMVTKLWILSGALMGVLFPAFTSTLASDSRRTFMLFDRSVVYLFFLLFIPVLVITVFASSFLTLWLGATFASHSARVLQWLAIGVFVNSVAGAPPFAVLQAAHRPDLPAKLHIIETPLYLFLVYFLIIARGIEGAAIAWALRLAANALVLQSMTWHLFPLSHEPICKTVVMMSMGLMALGGALMLPRSIEVQLLYCVTALVSVSYMAWFRVLSMEERAQIVSTSKLSWVKA